MLLRLLALSLAPAFLAQDAAASLRVTPPPATPSRSPASSRVAVPFDRLGSPALSPDGRTIAFAALDPQDRSHIYLVPSDGGETIALTTGAFNDHSPRFSSDGAQVAFVSDRAGNADIYTVSVGGGAPSQVTADPSADLDPEWSPDAKRIVFSSNRGGNRLLHLVAASGGQVFPLSSGTGPDRRPAWSPDGAWIAFERWRGAEVNVWIIPSAGGEARRLGDASGAERSPSWSADSRRVRAFATRGRASLLIDLPIWDAEPSTSALPVEVDPDVSLPALSRQADRMVYVGGGGTGIGLVRFGHSPGKTVLRGGVNRHPSWSPDRRKLVFSSNRDGRWDLYAASVTSGRMVRLTDTEERELDPHWASPAGDIVFSLESPMGAAIMILEPETGKMIQVVGEPGHNRDPVWSPDGKWIAYASDREGGFDIWVAQVSDSKARRLTSLPGSETHPTWSPDGKWIAFASRQGGGSEIWKVQVEGDAAPQRLTTGSDGADDLHPDWSPKDTWILYTHTAQGESSILGVPVKGGKPFPLLRETGVRLSRPAWSRDAEHFSYEWSSPDRLLVVELGG